MTLQDQIDSFQKLIFAHFRGGSNNECRIAALVPLVQESYGIYKFITSMLRAMHTTLGGTLCDLALSSATCARPWCRARRLDMAVRAASNRATVEGMGELT